MEGTEETSFARAEGRKGDLRKALKHPVAAERGPMGHSSDSERVKDKD